MHENGKRFPKHSPGDVIMYEILGGSRVHAAMRNIRSTPGTAPGVYPCVYVKLFYKKIFNFYYVYIPGFYIQREAADIFVFSKYLF